MHWLSVFSERGAGLLRGQHAAAPFSALYRSERGKGFLQTSSLEVILDATCCFCPPRLEQVSVLAKKFRQRWNKESVFPLFFFSPSLAVRMRIAALSKSFSGFLINL